MSQAKVYHYTSLPNAGMILGNCRQPGYRPGLEPHLGVKSTPPLEITRASFALLEPVPKSWTNNLFFPGVWNFLKERINAEGPAPILLEVSIDTQSNKVFVADWAHMEAASKAALYSSPLAIPSRYSHTNIQEAKQAYINSMIPIDEYLQGKMHGEVTHSIPEVLILEHLSRENIHVSTIQPLLEENLAWARKWGEDKYQEIASLILLGYIAKELMPWRKSYEAKYGPLELIGRSKEGL